MGVLDCVKEKVKNIFNSNKSTAEYLQYIHIGSCKSPCVDCPSRNLKIYKNGEEISLPAHFNCDCKYNDIAEQSAGTISNKGLLAPDVYLKAFGKLPDYYLTKQEAEKYGWRRGKNLAHFAPNKMIGGDEYKNKEGYLPQKEGRVWYECDVDYASGNRLSERLFYSNDGLMFYSINHGKSEFILIK